MKERKKEKRFVRVFNEYSTCDTRTDIFIDKETGINYLLMRNGYSSTITPLLDTEGKPIVSDIDSIGVKNE